MAGLQHRFTRLVKYTRKLC